MSFSVKKELTSKEGREGMTEGGRAYHREDEERDVGVYGRPDLGLVHLFEGPQDA